MMLQSTVKTLDFVLHTMGIHWEEREEKHLKEITSILASPIKSAQFVSIWVEVQLGVRYMNQERPQERSLGWRHRLETEI